MAHHIKKDKPAAITADVAYQIDEIGLGQVMTKMHRKRHIGAREWIVYGVGPHDRNANLRRFAWVQVDPNHLYSELALDILSDEAGGAPYIENAANRQCISADRANHERRIPDQSVNAGELTVCAGCLTERNSVAIEYLGFVLPLHRDHKTRSPGAPLKRYIERTLPKAFPCSCLDHYP